jgi:hypothetical protein
MSAIIRYSMGAGSLDDSGQLRHASLASCAIVGGFRAQSVPLSAGLKKGMVLPMYRCEETMEDWITKNVTGCGRLIFTVWLFQIYLELRPVINNLSAAPQFCSPERDACSRRENELLETCILASLVCCTD